MINYRGVVTRAEDGEPFEGASVHLRVTPIGQRSLVLSATSDDEGLFSIDVDFDPSMAHATTWCALASGRISGLHGGYCQRGDVDLGVISTSRSPCIVGTVTDVFDRPIEGVEIDIGPAWRGVKVPALSWDDWPPLSRTDAEGRFVFEGIGLSCNPAADLFVMGARHPDYHTAIDYFVLDALKRDSAAVVDFEMLSLRNEERSGGAESSRNKPRFPLAIELRHYRSKSSITNEFLFAYCETGDLVEFQVAIDANGDLDSFSVPSIGAAQPICIALSD